MNPANHSKETTEPFMSGKPGRSGGRNRLPTSIKITKGTVRQSRTKPNEPTPTRGIPPAPPWLDAEALPHYERLGFHVNAMGVVSLHDGESLALTASALTEYLEAKRKCKNKLTVIRHTKYGSSEVANPAASLRNDAWRRVQSGLASFGLDPRARGTVSALTQDEPESEFFN
jgi:P27 family predicted phage terminase small subunit